MRYNLNFGDTHEANSKAISFWAYVPPWRPAFAMMPREFVFSTHCLTDSRKRFVPASFLIPPNSVELKSGLYISSQIPRNSIVFLSRSHFSIRDKPFSITLTRSVNEM